MTSRGQTGGITFVIFIPTGADSVKALPVAQPMDWFSLASALGMEVSFTPVAYKIVCVP